jgi:uncharacterized OB-fold protein
MTENATYDKPLPKMRKLDEPYWEGTKAGELRLQHCLDDGAWWSPPGECCPQCLGHNYEWKKSSGLGTIWTRIFMHQKYYKAFEDDIPYNVVWIALDEGPMMTANVVDATNDEIQIGRRVEVVFDPVTDEVTIPRFRLIG